MVIVIAVTNLVTKILIAEPREKINVWNQRNKEIEDQQAGYFMEKCGEESSITKT